MKKTEREEKEFAIVGRLTNVVIQARKKGNTLDRIMVHPKDFPYAPKFFCGIPVVSMTKEDK